MACQSCLGFKAFIPHFDSSSEVTICGTCHERYLSTEVGMINQQLLEVQHPVPSGAGLLAKPAGPHGQGGGMKKKATKQELQSYLKLRNEVIRQLDQSFNMTGQHNIYCDCTYIQYVTSSKAYSYSLCIHYVYRRSSHRQHLRALRRGLLAAQEQADLHELVSNILCHITLAFHNYYYHLCFVYMYMTVALTYARTAGMLLPK